MWVIAKKELKEMWRDGRLKYAGFLLLVLLVMASVVGVTQYQKTQAEYVAAKTAERSIWESQSDKNPHSAAHYGTYAFKPKFALSLIDNGVNNYTGNSIFLEAHRRNEATYSAASDATELSRFGNLSLSFILLHLFPLLILLLGYNSISKEREMDTLRLLKSQSVRPLRLIMGKWISIFLPVLAITTGVFIIVGILLSSAEGVVYFDWGSLAMMWMSYMLYYMVITSLVMLISLWSKSSGMALVLSLFVWIVFGFITPKIATNITNNLHPYPTKQTFQAAIKKDKDNGLDGHNPWNEEAKLLKEKTLKEYGVDSIEQLPFNYDGFRMQKGEEHQAAIYKKHYAGLKETFHKQNKSYGLMAALSPFIPLRLLSMNIANTSYIAHWNFSDAEEDYRIEKQRFLNHDFRDNSKTGEWDYKMTSDGFKKLPVFKYVPPSISEIIRGNMSNLGILVLWLLIPLFILIFWAKKL